MKKRVTYVATAALLIATALFSFFKFSGAPNIKSQSSGLTSATNFDAPPRNISTQVPRPQQRQLPVPGAPLLGIYDDLSSRAIAGDADAAMRLFADLTKCKNREKRMMQVNQFSFPYDKNKKGDDWGIAHPETIEKNLQYLDATDSLCSGISNAAIERRGDLLRQAALDGSPQAMVCYAKSTLDAGPSYLTNTWFDYADRWIQEAPYLAQQAFDLGQADVIPLLVDAYTPVSPSTMKSYQFSELVSPDAQTAYGLALLYRRLVPSSSGNAVEDVVAGLKATLTLDQQQAAQQFADTNWSRFSANAGSEKNIDPCFGEH